MVGVFSGRERDVHISRSKREYGGMWRDDDRDRACRGYMRAR